MSFIENILLEQGNRFFYIKPTSEGPQGHVGTNSLHPLELLAIHEHNQDISEFLLYLCLAKRVKELFNTKLLVYRCVHWV